MVSQVPQDEVQTPNAECQTAEGEDLVQESGPRYSAFRLPPEAVEPIAEAAREAGVEVYHAEFSGRELRVQVECDAGATVDTCTDYSRALTPLLDAVNFMHRQYTLEVSTPGIERKLYQPQDYTKAVNKHVKALVRGGWVEGVLEAAGPNGITLRTERSVGRGPSRPVQKAGGGNQKPESRTLAGDGDSLREFTYADIREAQIRVSDSELFARSRAERN